MQFISEGSDKGEKAKSNDDEQIIGVRFYQKSSAKNVNICWYKRKSFKK